MIFRFTLLSDEVDNFKREIKIDSDATFADLQQIITQSVGFDSSQIASFFICNNYWEKQLEITSIEMETSSDEDSYVMDKVILSNILEDEKQKLLYTFDFLYERSFFMELSEIITGQYLDTPICSVSKGTPPPQTVDIDELENKSVSAFIDEESMYGDELDIDELDSDGFDGLNVDDIPE